MTAEIAIMNKEAIAMAADSAVTLRKEKVFTSANKIFALSKYQPVGVMVYGTADFMGVPWEVLVKMYRNRLGRKTFYTVRQYAHDFIRFLSREKRLYPESQQRQFFGVTVESYFRSNIREEIEKKAEIIFAEKGKMNEREVKKLTSDVIRAHRDFWRKAEFLPSVPTKHLKELKNKYGAILEEEQERVFEKLPITSAGAKQLKDIAVSLFAKWPLTPPDVSGVVIAGFGKRDVFPRLQSLLLHGVANNRLKHKEVEYIEVSFENTAWIVPFAQSEMVHTFMEGVDRDYKKVLEKDVFEIFNRYPEVIIDSIEELGEPEKHDLKKKLKKVAKGTYQRYQKQLEGYRDANFVQPVTRVVSMLPKEELAAMAESLVNLTLFKRKVSMEAETAAPPIDVAIISKGDGLVWIKRKHYFKAELNAQFFTNYYGEATK